MMSVMVKSSDKARMWTALLGALLVLGCSEDHRTPSEADASAIDSAAPDASVRRGGPDARTDARTDAQADVGSDPIEERIDRLFAEDPAYGTVDREEVRRMMEVPAEQDGPFFMVNFVKYRERALYSDGRETDLTGAQADQIYGQAVLPILGDIGARPVFVADVELTLQSDDGIQWDQVGVVLYPSRAAFFDMLERDDFREASVHKEAGIETTLVMFAQPTEDVWPEGFRAVDLSGVPNPPTEDDPPLAIVHLYAYRERAQYEDGRETELTGREAVDLYTQGREEQRVTELGVRPGLWLDIDGALLADERRWHEFRTNLFPSHETFWNVASTGEEAGIEHRVAGLEHLYTLITLPIIDEYGYE